MTPPGHRSGDPGGVLLIGHGTRDPVGTNQFFDLGAKLQRRLGDTPVESAVLEFGPPTIPQGWQRLIERGVTHIDVTPLLLFAAGHAKRDIPQIIAECRRQGPPISCQQCRPLSRHRSIVDLVTRRLGSAQQELAVAPQRTAVVMVGRGSHDPCAQADMRVLTEVAGRRLAAPTIQTAFYAMAEPRLPAVLDQVASSGRCDGIVVYPHLLFEGRLHQAIIDQTNEAARCHSSIRFVTASILGPDESVVEAIAERIG